jgi:hypothetical protein
MRETMQQSPVVSRRYLFLPFDRAYLEEDGALLCISLEAALSSLAITSAIVWATIRATDLLD